MADVVEHLRVHDRVALEHPVVGLRQPVAGQVADDELDHAGEQQLLDAEGQGRPAVGEDVGGLAEQVLGEEPVAAAHAERGRGGADRGVGGDVAAGVAGADDQHAPVAEQVGGAVLAGVDLLAGELARVVGHPRLPLVAGRRDEVRVGPGAAVGEPHRPAILAAGGRLDLGPERDPVLEPAVAGEVPQVGEHLGPRRVVGEVLGERVALEPRERPRRDEVGRLVHRRARVVDVPDAADRAVALEHLEADPGPVERLGRREPCRPGADDPDWMVVAHGGGSWWTATWPFRRVLVPV